MTSELHTGRRLTCDKVVRPHHRARRPLFGSSSPASIGNEIRRGCQFVHGLFRSLGHLAGGCPLSTQCPFFQGPPLGVCSVVVAFLLGPGKVVICVSCTHFFDTLEQQLSFTMAP